MSARATDAILLKPKITLSSPAFANTFVVSRFRLAFFIFNFKSRLLFSFNF